jgi:hypothetical protein
LFSAAGDRVQVTFERVERIMATGKEHDAGTALKAAAKAKGEPGYSAQ